MSRFAWIFLWAGLFAAGGCTGESETSYRQQILQERVQRDMQMREKESVLPPERRDSFRGLDYYPVDSTYRFEVVLRRRTPPDTVTLAENTGRVREQVRLGHVAVPLPAKTVQLAVFRGASSDARGRLWIPFGDDTNTDSTYKGGRYVDLQPIGGDSVVVDFNRAYNPTCVYNPEFACPLPPPQNRIETPIPAGEKIPEFRRSGSTGEE